MAAIDNYYAALERLLNNNPEVLKKGSYKINQDAVCIESGVKRGSIKPVRGSQYEALAEHIKEAAKKYESPLTKAQETDRKLKKRKEQVDEYQQKYRAAVNRELMLIRRVKELEERVKVLEGNVVAKIRS
jgi:hypothetical protein